MATAIAPPDAIATPQSAFPQAQNLLDEHIHISLTYDPLDLNAAISHVRSPSAGAIVTFSGTTRDSFNGRAVSSLSYSTYAPLALRTMLQICKDVRAKHKLFGISMIHRLGTVPIGEESILICVSSAHRQEAWRAGEEALERCKEKVEVWKMETFNEGEGESVWRANRDGQEGVRVDLLSLTTPLPGSRRPHVAPLDAAGSRANSLRDRRAARERLEDQKVDQMALKARRHSQKRRKEKQALWKQMKKGELLGLVDSLEDTVINSQWSLKWTSMILDLEMKLAKVKLAQERYQNVRTDAPGYYRRILSKQLEERQYDYRQKVKEIRHFGRRDAIARGLDPDTGTDGTKAMGDKVVELSKKIAEENVRRRSLCVRGKLNARHTANEVLRGGDRWFTKAWHQAQLKRKRQRRLWEQIRKAELLIIVEDLEDNAVDENGSLGFPGTILNLELKRTEVEIALERLRNAQEGTPRQPRGVLRHQRGVSQHLEKIVLKQLEDEWHEYSEQRRNVHLHARRDPIDRGKDPALATDAKGGLAEVLVEKSMKIVLD